MPSEPQNTLYDTISANTESDLGKANHTKLKSAFSNHKNSILKDAAITKMTTGNAAATQEVDVTSAAIKEFYSKFVKRGTKNIAGSGFAGEDAANLDYSGAPTLGSPVPAGEAAPGGDGETKGSTIVKSGLGPNVNVHPIGSISERLVVDPNYSNPIDVGDNKDGQNDASPSDNKADTLSIPPGTIETGYDY